MGGSIAITIREKDGKEHRMCRWTNPIPYFVNNIGLINKDKAHLKGYLKQWYDMVKDAKTAAGRKRSPMAKGYVKEPYLAPLGYGLIVIDMQNDVIIDCQGYSRLGRISAVNLRIETHQGEVAESDSATTSFKALHKAKRISGVEWHDGAGSGHAPIKGTLKSIFSSLHKEDDPLHMGFFIIDMSPFKIERYPEYDAMGYKGMLKRVKELGFKLSKREERLWQEEIKRLED